MPSRLNLIKYSMLAFLLGFPLLSCAADDSDLKWNTQIKNQYFGSREIVESDTVIKMTAPYRAEDPAMVPISVHSKIPQKADQYIERITLFVDQNPEPFVGEFEFSQESGRTDLALRVRINAYSYVRAIAALNDGRLYMTKVFVKASGGCSAPIGADLEAAMQRIGKMKFRVEKSDNDETPLLTQLLISHPNITGMQMDQVSRLIKPAHFIQRMEVTFNRKPVLSAKTDIAISADPNFRFYFVPEESGVLQAKITDNKGQSWTSSYQVGP